MRKFIAIIIGTGLLLTSCETEEIVPVEYTTIHVTAEPSWGDGVVETGDSSFSSWIDGVDFVSGISNITNELDAILTIYAYDDLGENGFQIWLPLMTMTEDDHALTYPGTAGYGFSCLKDDFAYYPSDDAGNIITILEFDDVANHVKGEFSLDMEVDGGGTFLENVTGEFDVNY